MLKPRHSAFYGTPLEFLLSELGTRRLVIVGLETDQCILCTAQDAYMRKFNLRVPRNCVATRFPPKGLAALDLMRAHLGADVRSR